MAFPTGWTGKKRITIDHTKVSGGSPLSNFPVLIKDGNIPSDAYAAMKQSGEDIRFTTDKAGTTEIPFEIVRLDAAAEEAEIWVKVPTVDNDEDTEFFMWYGKDDAESYAPNDTYGSEAVWSDYAAKYSLQNIVYDSASAGLTLTNNNLVQAGLGKIGIAADFGPSNTNKYLSRSGGIPVDLSTASLLFWVKIQNEPGTNTSFRLVDWRSTTGTASRMIITYADVSGTKKLQVQTGAGTLEYNTTLGTSSWHHIAVTYGASDEVILYLNGTQVATHTKVITGAGTGVGIGADPSGNFPSSIFIDNISFLPSTLPSSRVSTEYNNQNDPSTFLEMSSLGQISGTCTLEGTPVEGAIITLINSATDEVVATELSDVNGEYAFLNLDPAGQFHVVAEYMDGYDLYNAKSLPFMTPEEV